MDIVLNFFTSFRQYGEKITTPDPVARHYLKTLFLIDLLATVPLDAFFLGGEDLRVAGVSLVLVLRQLRLLRVVRLFVIFRRWQSLSWTNSGYLRIAKYFTIFMLLVHWIACAWFLVPYLEGFPENCWVVQQGIEHANPLTQYIRALYWVIQTMATVGYGDITPHRDFEYVFSIVIMLIGASTYAFIIGNIASLASNLDAARASFFNRIEAISQYLHSRQVPPQLNEQVRNYYEYLWAHHRGVEGGVPLRGPAAFVPAQPPALPDQGPPGEGPPVQILHAGAAQRAAAGAQAPDLRARRPHRARGGRSGRRFSS